jgi:hypothetical protein
MFRKRALNHDYTHEMATMVDRLRATGQLIQIPPGSQGKLRRRLNDSGKEVVIINSGAIREEEEVEKAVRDHKDSKYVLIFDDADRSLDYIAPLILRVAMTDRSIFLIESPKGSHDY